MDQQVGVVKRGKSRGWDEAEVQLGPVDVKASPPVYRNPLAGTTKYPFHLMELNQLLYVSRPKNTVKDAVKRYVKLHRGLRFSVWKGSDGRTVVKRIK